MSVKNFNLIVSTTAETVIAMDFRRQVVAVAAAAATTAAETGSIVTARRRAATRTRGARGYGTDGW